MKQGLTFDEFTSLWLQFQTLSCIDSLLSHNQVHFLWLFLNPGGEKLISKNFIKKVFTEILSHKDKRKIVSFLCQTYNKSLSKGVKSSKIE